MKKLLLLLLLPLFIQAQTTVFEPVLTLLNRTSGTPFWVRSVIPASLLTDMSGNRIRVTWQASTTTNTPVSGSSIGERSGSTDDYTAGTVVRLLYSGAESTTITANTTGTSDWAVFDYDGTKDLIVHFETGAPTYDHVRESAGSSFQSYWKVSDADAELTETVTGTTSITRLYNVVKIEVMTVSTGSGFGRYGFYTGFGKW